MSQLLFCLWGTYQQSIGQTKSQFLTFRVLAARCQSDILRCFRRITDTLGICLLGIFDLLCKNLEQAACSIPKSRALPIRNGVHHGKSLTASSILFLAMLKYPSSSSMPIKWRFVFTQATPQEPLPIKPSKTTAFSSDELQINAFSKSTGFSVGWFWFLVLSAKNTSSIRFPVKHFLPLLPYKTNSCFGA